MNDEEIIDMKFDLNEALSDIFLTLNRLTDELEDSLSFTMPLRRAVARLQDCYTNLK